MIIAEIGRGLGNSMYVYAAALALAKHKKTELKLDTSYLRGWPRWEKYGGLWEFELGRFNISAKEATKKEVRKFVLKTGFRPIDKMLRKYKLFDRNVIYFPSHGSLEDFFNLPDNSYLRGYLGREKFFEKIIPIIRKEFTLQEENLVKIRKELDSIKKENSVSIQVRRGDVLKLKNAYILGEEYYRQAVEIIMKKVKNPRIYLFSDDPEWCKKNLNFGENLAFIEDGSLGGYEVLELMKNCKHNILGNSALSWWAGYLNDNPKKIVIAPKNFTHFNDVKVEDNVLPKDWIAI